MKGPLSISEVLLDPYLYSFAENYFTEDMKEILRFSAVYHSTNI